MVLGRLLCLVLVCTLFNTLAGEGADLPQTPSQRAPAGAISGVVVDAATKRPLPGAVVILELDRTGAPPTTLRPGPLSQQLTDEKGRFVFTPLPAAKYFVNASMPGYFDGGYGRPMSTRTGTPIALADRQWFDRADIQLSRPGAVTGRVIDEHGDPVVGVPVRVLRQVMVAGKPQVASSSNTTTDDRGMYRIGGLTPGRYYASVPSVQMAAPPEALAAALSSNPSTGRSSTTADPTLDLGGQRLVVGRFAPPPLNADGRATAYPPLFYPGTSSLNEAGTIELDFGVDKSAIDFRLMPVPAFAVSGVVQGPQDALSQLTLRLLPAGSEELGIGAEAATALVAPDGRFTFVNVPAGEYTIDARATITEYEFNAGSARYSLPTPPGARNTGGSAMSLPSGTPGTGMTTMQFGGDRYWGRATVSVGGRDIRDIALPLREAVRITGHYVLDGTASPPPASIAAFIRAEPAGGRASLGQPRNTISPRDESSNFAIEGLLPGEYVLRFSSTGGNWIVKSIVWDGHDYTHAPFDASRGRDFTNVVVTFTDKLTSLEGSVTAADGRQAPAGVVIAFPVEKEQWSNYGLTPLRIATSRISNAGTFRITTLPAGEYFVIAVSDVHATAWHDPSFLEAAAARASRVRLAWGQSISTSLRMSR
jgi:hypothetical protein